MALGKSSLREVLAVAMVLTKQGEIEGQDSRLNGIMLQKLGYVNSVLDAGRGENYEKATLKLF